MTPAQIDWSFWGTAISMAATVAFAVTAVVAIERDKDIDVVAASVLGLTTAIGGGTIRDVIMGVPVFWSLDLWYVWIALASSIGAFFGRRLVSARVLYSLFLYLDGLGAAMFGIQATGKAWDHEFGLPVAPVILGLITAIGGGLLRDTLAGRETLLMGREIYATPVVIGCIAYVLVIEFLPDHRVVGGGACIVAAFALRAAAIYWNLTMPDFVRTKRHPGGGS